MPIGVFIDTFAVAFGGFLGSVMGSKVTADFKEKLNLVLGLCSMSMGISSIALMQNMPAVVFAVIVGTVLGMALNLEDRINRIAIGIQGAFSRIAGSNSGENVNRSDQFVIAIVLFCASGTGIYGALVSGMNGDHSILIAKSILDLFTAMIFAGSLGLTVSSIALPQGIIFCFLFALAGVIYPLTNSVMIGDFKACGGVIMLATGFRMTQLKHFNVADMIPAMILVMPFSFLWVSYILPIVNGCCTQ